MTKVQESPVQPAILRINRANTLRTISRLCYAVDGPALPAPVEVRFNGDGVDQSVILVLRFDTFEDAAAWGEHLGAEYPRELVYQPDWRDGQIRNYSASADWRGYHVQIDGWTPVDGGESR